MWEQISLIILVHPVACGSIGLLSQVKEGAKLAFWNMILNKQVLFLKYIMQTSCITVEYGNKVHSTNRKNTNIALNFGF